MEIRGSLIADMELYETSNRTKNEAIMKVENKKDFSVKELESAVNKLNKELKNEECYAEYKVHEKLGDIMIKIIDKNTKEVLLEVPPKKILDLVANLCENNGVILDRKA